MILVETFFINGEVIGVVRRDDYSGEIAFSPHKPPSKLPPRNWKNVDELKVALLKAYEEGPPDEVA